MTVLSPLSISLLVIIHDFIPATHASIRDMALTVSIEHDIYLCVICVEVDTKAMFSRNVSCRNEMNRALGHLCAHIG